MMRSLSSAVSGLKTMQTEMDVIGNNLANVNTPGFKKSRVVFQDALYQAMSGGSAPNGTLGGTNPMAIGLGTGLASVDQITTGSNNTTTNSPTDMAVDGDGYFMVKDADETLYTRAGAFKYDASYNLVDSNGRHVQGWLAAHADPPGTEIQTDGVDPVNINLKSLDTLDPRATSTMDVSGNLNAEFVEDNTTTPPQYYNDTNSSLTTPFNIDTDTPSTSSQVIATKEFYSVPSGNSGTLYFRFFKTIDSSTNVSQWCCDVSLDKTFTGTPTIADTADPPTTPNQLGDAADPAVYRFKGITFDADGKLSGVKDLNLVINRKSAVDSNENDVTVDVRLGGENHNLLTQYASDSTATVETQDGYGDGKLSSLSIGTDGTITGIYSNGQKKDLARVALVTFTNPSGLEQVGSNLFRESNNCGKQPPGTPGSPGIGTIMPGSLESSNVDLSEELTNMIVAQRGFSANSRIITVSDEMLQELVNLGK